MNVLKNVQSIRHKDKKGFYLTYKWTKKQELGYH